MEKLFITPKRKSSYRSDSEPSPEDKRLKESNSPAKISCDEDEVMEALGSKIDLVLSKLSNLETKMEELNAAVKGLQSNVFGERSRFSENEAENLRRILHFNGTKFCIR